MLFDLGSDIHVDSWQNWGYSTAEERAGLDWAALRDPNSELFLACGDTSNDPAWTFAELERIAEAYPFVLFVGGNHEHYAVTRSKWPANFVEQEFRTTKKDRIRYLGGDAEVLLGDTLFVGNTGWYDFKMGAPIDIEKQEKAWREGNPDFRHITFDVPPAMLAYSCAESLRLKVEAAQDRDDIKHIVVATHTVPHARCLVFKEGNFDWNAGSGAFGNTMMDRVWQADTKKKISVWVYGHTHHPGDFRHEHFRLVGNPRGYPFEFSNRGWKPLLLDSAEHGHVSAFGSIAA